MKIHFSCSFISLQSLRFDFFQSFSWGPAFTFIQFSSVTLVSDSMWPHEPQHARLHCPSPTPRVHPNPFPLSQWCHPTISFSGIPFSSCPQSFPALGCFPACQFFASGGQSIGVSASVLPMNIQDWFPLGWNGWISLQSKGPSRVFSSTTVQKHQFFGTQLSFGLTSIHPTLNIHPFQTGCLLFHFSQPGHPS